MAFPDKLLNEGEELIIDAHPHWWYFAAVTTRLVLAIVIAVALAIKVDNTIANYFGIALILIGVAHLGLVYIKWRTTDFVLTTDRLVTRSGVFSRQTHEIPLERINDLACHQTLFERLIHAGDLLIESAGERGQERFPNVADPFEVQNTIHRAMEGVATPKPNSSGNLSVPEQIDKLDELRQRGVISEAEFQDKKQRLLDRM